MHREYWVIIESGYWVVGLTVDVVVLPTLLVVVTTLPAPRRPPEVLFVPEPPEDPEVPLPPLAVPLLLPLVATAPAPPEEEPDAAAETAVVPVTAVSATVVVAPLPLAPAATSVRDCQ